MRRLAILGASGHGKVIADIAELCGWQEVCFFDDAWPGVVSNGHWDVVGNSDKLQSRLNEFDGVVVGIGNNRVRATKIAWLNSIEAPLISLVHPSAVLSRYAKIGAGSVVMAGVVVNVGTFIGSGAILNTGCSVDHDCILGNSVHISPGARLAGDVKVGDCSWIGIGAVVKQVTILGEGVVVGAGAAVVMDVPDDVLVTGVPAKVTGKT